LLIADFRLPDASAQSHAQNFFIEGNENRQSAIGNQQSANRQSAIGNRQSPMLLLTAL